MCKAGVLLFLLALVMFWGGPSDRAQAGPLDNLGKTKEPTGKDPGSSEALTKAAQPWSGPEERWIGRALAAKLAGGYGGLYESEAWIRYVNLVGRGLVPCSQRSDIRYRFAILNTDVIASFSTPAGYIFITKGMLEQLESEDELAGVLAHEIGHVALRQLERDTRQEAALSALLEGGLKIAEDTGNLTQTQADAQRMLIENIWTKFFDLKSMQGLKAQDEFDADRLAADNLAAMGYNPAGLLTLLTKLQSQQGAGALKYLAQTHPKPAARIKKLQPRIAQLPAGRTVIGRFRKYREDHPLN